ncbi:MAG TPA: tetratricopeptide repeat protein [Acidobacteriaceae bacterium]|jgi:tetratricopeptide (TPR) repeat protein|nr:tetratricopeptide repeat protein [Acidobacteriaceae bacterium]
MPLKWAMVVGLGLGMAGIAVAQPVPLPPGTSSPDQQATPGDSLAGIEAQIEAKQYVRATNALDAYLSAHPGDARALFDRGYVEDAQGNVDAAEGWYRKAIAADPKQFEARSALGLLLASKSDAGAVEQLQAAAQLEPNPANPAAKAQVDRVLARLEKTSNPTGASAALVDALRLTPETEEDTLLAAEIAEAAGDATVAEQEYRKVLAEDPGSAEATAGLAHLLIAQKRDGDAQPLVEAALRKHPDDPGLNAQLATILNAEGKQDQALAVLEKLHALEPGSQAVTAMLADADFQAGKLDEADALYGELLKAAPGDAGLLDAHGQILIRQQHYAEALAVFQRAVTAKPDDVDGWSGIAFAYSKLARYEGELAALSMRSKYAAENPSTLFLRATAYDNLHQTKAAADYYHRFLAAAQGKYPDQEWQAKHRLIALEK